MQSRPASNPDRHAILLIDDDRKLCRLIAGYLDPMGYDVIPAHTGSDGLDRIEERDWHAVLLDMMLPGMDGFEVLKRIRYKSNVPVLMLTARGEEADRIVGLELGADDYLPKTCSSREMLARLRAVTRRAHRPGQDLVPREKDSRAPELRVGALRMQPECRIATLGEAHLQLTPVEYDLLLSLASAVGRVKTREQLLEEIRERNYEVFDRSIDVHISALRKKLGDDPKSPRFIRTVRTLGYSLLPPDAT
jgi:DNA-binding response OmpR family regulator